MHSAAERPALLIPLHRNEALNAAVLFQGDKAAGFTEVHFSGTVFEDLGTTLPFSFKTESFLDETKRPISNVKVIREIISKLAN